MLRVSLLVLLSAATCARAAGPSAAALAQSIHDASLDAGECYRVRDVSFRKDDIRLYFTDGYLIFSKPVAGHLVSAVFTTEVEGGDGEVLLFPPTRGERQSMASFTNSPNLDEHFVAAMLIFTDGSGSALRAQIEKDGSGKKVPEMGALMSEKWSPVLANIREGFELRMIDDLLSPAARLPGFLFLGLAGRERGNFDILYDPEAREQIIAGQLADRGGRPRYNIWTSFLARSVRTGKSSRIEPGFSLSHFSIDATLDASLHMKAATKISVRVGPLALRSFPFEISGAMKVTSVRVDGEPAEVFSHDSIRERALRGSEDDGLLVLTADALAPGSEHIFTFEHEGDVIASAGNGVYFVGARATWYPHSAPQFSTYELTFRYPKRLTLVTAGDLISDRTDGETRITTRRPAAPIRFVGFNLGDYEEVGGVRAGFDVRVYGNRKLEAALQPKPEVMADQSSRPMTPQQRREALQEQAQMDSRVAVSRPDPLARLHNVSDDVSSSLEFYSHLFGAPVLNKLTVAPIPGTFGQGFPGLVYLSTVAYLDPNARPAGLRNENQQVFFSDLIVAHEVAHQWWGNVVISASYQDDWLMEALANYSALLWLEKKKGSKEEEAVLDDYRDRLQMKNSEGRTLESAGPIVWGARLDSSGSSDAWRAITYEKGAWIMHMLRRRLGTDRFLKMLAELRRRYEFKAVTTEQFRDLAAEFLPPNAPKDTLETFFDNWVYATGIPKFKIQTGRKGLKVSGTVTQSGVDDDFSADVPVEIRFTGGATQTVWVRTSNEPVSFSAAVKQAPASIGIGVYSVLSNRN